MAKERDSSRCFSLLARVEKTGFELSVLAQVEDFGDDGGLFSLRVLVVADPALVAIDGGDKVEAECETRAKEGDPLVCLTVLGKSSVPA